MSWITRRWSRRPGYTTELINPRGPWRAVADVEMATTKWVGWFNRTPLRTEIGDVPPAEYETIIHVQHQSYKAVGANN